MTSSKPRRNRRAVARRPFNGGGADHDDTQWLDRLRTDDVDGATITWPPGPPGGIAYLAAVAVTETGPDPRALARHRAEPRYAPVPAEAAEYIEMDPGTPPLALPPAPVAAPAPASAETTEPAVIGDALRLPVIWCEMPGCITWHHDPASTGFADSRERAAAAGWRTDALGRLACPPCQQARADYWTPQPLTWHHPEVARRWDEDGTLPGEKTQARLEAEAECFWLLFRKDPTLARALADATHRTAAS